MGVVLVCLLGVGGPVSAQWSDDPALNLAITTVGGDQVQPKIVVRPGGGYYVSWFDNRVSGYDVYLQLLDEQGVEQWAHNGVLVADRSFSSTQDYGLSVDTAGNALLVFRDDRFTGTQITAAMVDATGSLVWGANGVQLTDTTAFVAAPKIAGTTDGEIVVAWKSDAEAHLQRLDATGAAVWADIVVIVGPEGDDDYSVSDLHDSGNGSVIVSLVFQPDGFMGPKHLHAQKISDLGANLWGSSPLAVYDGGSLQFGNFPVFVPDGLGGAAFSWYNTSGELQCYAQHVSSAGTESFPHNGSAVSTALRDRSAPAVAYDPVTSSTYVFWDELQPGPIPDYGIYGQRFDATGVRQWGNEGIVVVALSSTQVGSSRVTLDGSGVIAYWTRTLAVGNQNLYAARVDANGAFTWTPSHLAFATSASTKSRLAARRGPAFAVLAWTDDRSGTDDIFVQNINPDGTLGPPATGPGEVAGFRITKGPGASELTFTWEVSCEASADYGVFEGTLASLRTDVYDHDPVVCTDEPPLLEETITPLDGDSYYLVVPLGSSAEGSHGK
jgi:hypothetical protein